MAAIKTLLVARLEPPSADFCAKAAQLGLEVWHRSMLRVELAERAQLRTALAAVAPNATLIFSSQVAARAVQLHCPNILSQHALMAVGAGTAKALEPHNVRFPSRSEGAQALLDLLAESLNGHRFCLIQAPDALTILLDGLVARGAEVSIIEAYRRIRVPMDALERKRLQSVYCVDVGSGAQLQALVDAGLPAKTPMLLPSQRVKALAKTLGMLGLIEVCLSEKGLRFDRLIKLDCGSYDS
jgi:uroporphyrinogen-III synthase